MIDVKIDEQKMSMVRRYYMEISLSILTAAVIYLFLGQKSMEKDMRSYLQTDRVELVKKLEEVTTATRESTGVIKESNVVSKEILEILTETKNKK